MSISPALQAQWDQERRMVADHIRTFGVHLTYVSEAVGPHEDGSSCARCPGFRNDDGEDDQDDAFGSLFLETGGDPGLLPPRTEAPFCYTTGLYGVGHAELVVLGLEQGTVAPLLNEVAHRVLDHGLDLVPGQIVEAAGMTLLVEDLPCSGMVLFETHSFYRRPPWEPMEAFQLVWADDGGRFPWDAGHDRGRWGQQRAGEWRA